MNDYKELLKTLRALCSVKDYEQCEYNLEAADAIEELVTKCQQLEKERDAAAEEPPQNLFCSSCKWREWAATHFGEIKEK